MNVMIGSCIRRRSEHGDRRVHSPFRLRGLRFRHDTQHRNARLLAPPVSFSAKLIAAVMLATAVMTIACMAAGYLIGLIFSGSGVEPFDANTVKILLCQLAVMLAEGALFYAISTVFAENRRLHRRVLVLPMVLDHCPHSCRHTALAEKDIPLSAYWLERIPHALVI